jgi:hypothetical protein
VFRCTSLYFFGDLAIKILLRKFRLNLIDFMGLKLSLVEKKYMKKKLSLVGKKKLDKPILGS